MGRKVHLGSSSTENVIDVFGYTPSPYIGTKEAPSPYVEQPAARGFTGLPARWGGKQLGIISPKKGPYRADGRSGRAGTVFEGEFKRVFAGDGYAADIKSKTASGLMDYTMTVNTERLRETLRKEQRMIVKGAVEARETLKELRRQSHEDMQVLRKNMGSAGRSYGDRRYRPTASNSIGTSHMLTTAINSQNYLPAVHGMPAAYRNPHARRPFF